MKNCHDDLEEAVEVKSCRLTYDEKHDNFSECKKTSKATNKYTTPKDKKSLISNKPKTNDDEIVEFSKKPQHESKSDFKKKKVVTNKIIKNKKAERALKFFESYIVNAKESRKSKQVNFKKVCRPSSFKTNWPEKCEFTWDSSSFIHRNIRSCILTQDWKNLTDLLLFLMQHNIPSNNIRHIAKLNILKSYADPNQDVLKEFLKLMKIKFPS